MNISLLLLRDEKAECKVNYLSIIFNIKLKLILLKSYFGNKMLSFVIECLDFINSKLLYFSFQKTVLKLKTLCPKLRCINYAKYSTSKKFTIWVTRAIRKGTKLENRFGSDVSIVILLT